MSEHREKTLVQFTADDRTVWIGSCVCGYETRAWPTEFQAEGQLYERHINPENEKTGIAALGEENER